MPTDKMEMQLMITDKFNGISSLISTRIIYIYSFLYFSILHIIQNNQYFQI